MTTATAKIELIDGNWVGSFNGRKIVKSYDQTRVVKMMAKAGHPKAEIIGADVSKADEIDEQSDWNINERFGFVAQLTRMVAKRQAVSLIVTGPGGLGKTHTVREALEQAGLQDASGFDVVESSRTFRVIKGYSTAKGLYRELFQNQNSILVFDDCDSIQKDPVALALLKGALDSYDKRIISWNADMKDDDLPRSFQFNGGVIFISNYKRSQLDDALLTRANCVDLAMTMEQKLERMTVLATSDKFMPTAEPKHKADALALIVKLGADVRELSLRTLQSVTRIRAAGGNWEQLATYTLTNR